MNAIRAIYDGTSFKPLQPIPVEEEYEVIITFIEPIKKGEAPKRSYADKDLADSEKTNTDMYVSEKLPRSTIKGFLKGNVWMSSDFDEPLEEMEEYMG